MGVSFWLVIAQPSGFIAIRRCSSIRFPLGVLGGAIGLNSKPSMVSDKLLLYPAVDCKPIVRHTTTIRSQ